MLRETHVHGELFAHRFRGEDPIYALVISHGTGGHGGIYDRFCVHHAALGVDVWSYDAPGHGRSTTTRPRGQWTLAEWVESAVSLAEHVTAQTGLPVFSMGSSLGVAAAFGSLHADAVRGAILMGSPAVPSTPLFAAAGAPWRNETTQQALRNLGRAARLDLGIFFDFDKDYGYPGAGDQKRLDPFNTWSYDLASWASLFTYDPKIPASENRKPILVSCGEKDPNFPQGVMKKVADAIAGPVEYRCLEGASHQLMLFHTDAYSRIVHDWAVRHLPRA